MNKNNATQTAPAWCITFFLYDNKWYDRKYKGENGYLSLEYQRKQLFIWLNSIPKDDNVKIYFVEIEIDALSNRFELIQYENTGKGLSLKVFKNRMRVDMGTDSFSLTAILKNTFGKTNAEKNMLVTIGHGSAFGINLYNHKDDTDQNYAYAQSVVIEKFKDKFNKNQTDFLSNILQDYQKIYNKIENYIISWKTSVVKSKLLVKNFLNAKEILKQKEPLLEELNNALNYKAAPIDIDDKLSVFMLTNKEIDEALKKVFITSKKLDILVLDSCLMQNIFTQYELKDSVDYLVASQSGITFPGHNYKGVIEGINQNNKMTVKEVANSFTSRTIIENHPAYPVFHPHIEDTWCFSSIQLDSSKLISIKLNFENFLNKILLLSSDDFKKFYYDIVNIQRRMFKYDVYSLSSQLAMVDLLLFSKSLYSETSILHPNLVTVLEALKKLIESLEANYKGNITFFKAKALYNDNVFPQIDDSSIENWNVLSAGIPFPLGSTPFALLQIIIEKNKNPHNPSFLTNNYYEDLMSKLKW
jgi:Clostripain family